MALYWIQIESLISIQRRFQHEIVDKQIQLYRLTEARNMRWFWLAQFVFLAIYSLCFAMDHVTCTKLWNRSANLCFYILFFFVFLGVYPHLCRTAEFSAYYSY